MFKYLALALVLATANAAHINSQKDDGPTCKEIAMKIKEKCDTNDNDKISWKEARACGAPKKFKEDFLRVAGKDKQVDFKEFMGECVKHN